MDDAIQSPTRITRGNGPRKQHKTISKTPSQNHLDFRIEQQIESPMTMSVAMSGKSWIANRTAIVIKNACIMVDLVYTISVRYATALL